MVKRGFLRPYFPLIRGIFLSDPSGDLKLQSLHEPTSKTSGNKEAGFQKHYANISHLLHSVMNMKDSNHSAMDNLTEHTYSWVNLVVPKKLSRLFSQPFLDEKFDLTTVLRSC